MSRGKRTSCACVTPDELPNGHCGTCQLPRIGDDLTPSQFDELTRTLSRVFPPPDYPQRLVRVHGRKRPLPS